jgi:glyoxylase-like metal-dependent hydrolase (beta-lactamase superfamily II)
MGKPSWDVEVVLAGSWRGATSALLSNGRHHVLVDTGMPHEAHLLAQGVEKRGLHLSDIRFLINTHFHVDHVLNNALLPNSEIYGSQESYEWCRSLYSDLLDEQNWEKLALKYYPETWDYENARNNMRWLRKFALRWWNPERLGDPSQFRWIETYPLPEGLEGLVTSGHVPGHTSVIAHGANSPVVIAGDALLTRDHDAEVLTMVPYNREQFSRDRARILSLAGRIVPGHDQVFSIVPGANRGE